MHQYLGTVYQKPKTFKWIYNKNTKQKWIPNLFGEHNIYLFQSIVHVHFENAMESYVNFEQSDQIKYPPSVYETIIAQLPSMEGLKTAVEKDIRYI